MSTRWQPIAAGVALALPLFLGEAPRPLATPEEMLRESEDVRGSTLDLSGLSTDQLTELATILQDLETSNAPVLRQLIARRDASPLRMDEIERSLFEQLQTNCARARERIQAVMARPSLAQPRALRA